MISFEFGILFALLLHFCGAGLPDGYESIVDRPACSWDSRVNVSASSCASFYRFLLSFCITTFSSSSFPHIPPRNCILLVMYLHLLSLISNYDCTFADGTLYSES